MIQAKHSSIDFDFMQYALDRLLGGLQFAVGMLPEEARKLVEQEQEAIPAPHIRMS